MKFGFSYVGLIYLVMLMPGCRHSPYAPEGDRKIERL